MMHVGDTKSTSGDVGGIPRVHQGILGGYREYSGGYHEYIGRCSVHWRDIMMHVGSKLIKSFKFLLKTPMY